MLHQGVPRAADQPALHQLMQDEAAEQLALLPPVKIPQHTTLLIYVFMVALYRLYMIKIIYIYIYIT